MVDRESLDLLQQTIRAWHERNYPKESLNGSLLAITEELGEVARAYVKQECGVRGDWDHWQGEKAKEIGDVLIGVINLCAREGFDWFSCLEQRWATISQRDFIANPQTGGREREAAS